VDAGDLEDCAEEGLRRLVQHPGLERVPFVLFSSADEWSLRALARDAGRRDTSSKKHSLVTWERP